MSTSYNVDTAPRDAAELSKIGRFNLRNIATALGLMQNEKEKAEFMALANEQMGAVIAPVLHELDKAKNGSPKGAAAKPAEQPVRTPVTSQSRPAVQAQNQAEPAPGAVGVVELVRALDAVKLAVAETSQALQGRFDNVESGLETVRAILKGTNRILLTNMALSLFLAEEVLKTDRAAIIKTAHDDVQGLVASLEELDPGITSGDEEEEEEAGEEAEEGKE